MHLLNALDSFASSVFRLSAWVVYENSTGK